MLRSFRVGHICRAESNAYPSELGSTSYDSDPQRMGYGCFHRNLLIAAWLAPVSINRKNALVQGDND